MSRKAFSIPTLLENYKIQILKARSVSWAHLDKGRIVSSPSDTLIQQLVIYLIKAVLGNNELIFEG